jgi:hypothetical protein
MWLILGRYVLVTPKVKLVDRGHHEQFHKCLPDGTTVKLCVVQLLAFSALTMPLPVVQYIWLETHKTTTCFLFLRCNSYSFEYL